MTVLSGNCVLTGNSLEHLGGDAIGFDGDSCTVRGTATPPAGWVAASPVDTSVAWLPIIYRARWTNAPQSVTGEEFTATLATSDGTDALFGLDYNEYCTGPYDVTSGQPITFTVVKHGGTCKVIGQRTTITLSTFSIADTLSVAV